MPANSTTPESQSYCWAFGPGCTVCARKVPVTAPWASNEPLIEIVRLLSAVEVSSENVRSGVMATVPV